MLEVVCLYLIYNNLVVLFSLKWGVGVLAKHKGIKGLQVLFLYHENFENFYPIACLSQKTKNSPDLRVWDFEIWLITAIKRGFVGGTKLHSMSHKVYCTTKRVILVYNKAKRRFKKIASFMSEMGILQNLFHPLPLLAYKKHTRTPAPVPAPAPARLAPFPFPFPFPLDPMQLCNYAMH